jgi:hypothetical protein
MRPQCFATPRFQIVTRLNKMGQNRPGQRPPPIAFLVFLFLACGLFSCSPGTPVIDEADYPIRIVGDWRGTEGTPKETISFYADGKFACHLRPSGFVSIVLAQGATGRIHGTWRIEGKSITLHVLGAEDEHVVYRIASNTIETLLPNQLIFKSESGATSRFLRRQMY